MNSTSIFAQSSTKTRSTHLQSLKNRRKLWLKVHLWLGLGLGLFLAIFGLTGSVLVFWQELDRALNPQLFRSQSVTGTARRTIDEIVTAAINEAPKGWQSLYYEEPVDENENVLVFFHYDQPNQQTIDAESFNVAVNPYSAQVMGHRVFYHAWNPLKHCFIGFIFKLHYAMLLGSTGVLVVGAMAVLLFVSVLSGFIVWWPLTGKWRRALTIKPRASIERFNHDLHQTTGFYSAIVVIALLVSGVYFNLPEQFRWLVNCVSSVTEEPAFTVQQPFLLKDWQSLSLRAQAEAGGGKPHYFTFTGSRLERFTACYRDVIELVGYGITDRCLVFNRDNGQLMQIIDPAHGSAGDVFLQWQWPLHSGKAFGWPGRILVFITGLVCPLLFITGLVRWLQKRSVKQIHAKL